MDRNQERLGRLPPEEKVALSMDMTTACVRICADGIRSQHQSISEQELIEKLRERLEWSKRHRHEVKEQLGRL
ncbi:MAG: hypothetical protein ACE14S_00620 [Candidatus Bathyarchaeia archaeon]